ncbi:MAG TPA: phosphotransferase family protein [Streptosporangiaceae bacterium]|jgi:aminoglycoside phosphotransferase (APT) family kinase protein
MAVPEQRDPELARQRLNAWLPARMPAADDVAITAVRTPSTNGFSSETLLFDAAWTRDGRRHEARYVARVAPTAYQIFPDSRAGFERQYRVLRTLADHTDIPVPAVHWFEPDPGTLGAPFYVMDHIEGRVPTDMPPYHQDGWVTQVPPAARTRMWWGTLEALARIHRLDHHTLGLDFLDDPRFGATGLDQRLGYYTDYLSWAYDGPQPTTRAALDWLRAHRPPRRRRPCLLWGDSRIGNVVFATDGTPLALLDWENAALGAPEEDLAWFCYLDRHHSDGINVPRLPGFPGRTETIAGYEEMLGRPLEDLDYYEVLSAFKFAVIMARIGQAFIDFELVPPDSDFPVNNTATQLLARVLDLPAPGGAPAPFI